MYHPRIKVERSKFDLFKFDRDKVEVIIFRDMKFQLTQILRV